MHALFTSALELIGLTLIVVCAALVFWPAAFGVAGIGLILLSRGITK